MSVPQSTEILAERVRFDIIAKTQSGHELRVWTDGHDVRWQDDEGRTGMMPAMLFRLAAHQLAHYCEDTAMGDANDSRHDDFLNHWQDSLSPPIDLAMADPYWAQPDHEANQLRFGFASIASNMSLDVQPHGLKPRESFGAGRRTDPEWGENQTTSEHPAQVFLESTVYGHDQGRIVSSNDLTQHQIAEAQATGRWFVAPNGLGWALLPWNLTTDKDRQREGLTAPEAKP